MKRGFTTINENLSLPVFGKSSQNFANIFCSKDSGIIVENTKTTVVHADTIDFELYSFNNLCFIVQLYSSSERKCVLKSK
jgi:hypothetical protein